MTYAQLQTDFPLWLKRTDLDTRLSGFVSIFESRVARKLRVRQMETSFSGTIDANNRVALPADFLAFRVIWPDGYQELTLRPQSLEAVLAEGRTAGTPAFYALDGTNVHFDGSGSVTGVYYAKVPGLVANGSNWLSTLAYEAYLFGVLAEAELYALNPAAAATYTARTESILSDIVTTAQKDAYTGPVAVRAR